MKIKSRILKTVFFGYGLFVFQTALFLQGQTLPPTADLHSRLKALAGAFIRKMDALPGFKEGYEIALIQPVDHKNPNAAKFVQRIFLSHRDYSKPVVLETEGYGATWPKEREAAKLLDANQIIVEHRYFESSKPKPLDWRFLTSWQAASDHHRIIDLLKEIYPGKWVTSGRSKGGMAALFHRSYYPGDVEATIAYVAPVMIGSTDPRFEIFMNSVGDESSRDKIKQFQKTCLERRNELLSLLKAHSEKRRLSFPCDLEGILEWMVIEFPYAYWSGNRKSAEIPRPDASAEQLWNFLNGVNPISSLSEAQLRFNAALYYQQATELGYYGYPTSHLAGLLRVVKEPDFSFYVPKDAPKAVFNGDLMPSVLSYLQREGNNIVYLYGEYDIWTSCAVELTGQTNALRLILKGKGHRFDIKDFPAEEKARIFMALEDWLHIKIQGHIK